MLVIIKTIRFQSLLAKANRLLRAVLVHALASVLALNGMPVLAQTKPIESTSAKTAAASSALPKTAPIAIPISVSQAVNTVPVAGSRVIVLDLLELGAWGSLKLKSANGVRRLNFAVRADEKVIAAKIVLAYDYSPSLNEELSLLKVSVNDKAVALERLLHARAAGVQKEVNLDPSLIKNFNELRFDFDGIYATSCSNPLQTNFWLTLSDPTRIELTVVPKTLAPDLRLLPAPFIDRADSMVNLPFVFSASPSIGSLRAAGVLASWFGIQSGIKGAKFSPYFNDLPNGNAIVVVSGDETVAGIKSDGTANIAIRQHPANPAARLLIVSGASEADVLSAARVVALNHRTLTGSSVKVLKELIAEARLPYDAPAWVRTDRPMKFGELTRLEDLKTQGFYPEVIRVNFRTPPDVFTWRTQGIPMQLKYRATRFSHLRSTALGVGINNNFIDTISLNSASEQKDQDKNLISKLGEVVQSSNKSVREMAAHLPPYSLGGRDQLQFSYSTEITASGPCDLPANNFVASIDAESSLDFSVFPKFAAMPNLGFFATSGYPFTRLADLSETSVVLSDKPSVQEVQVYLRVMSKMGEASGYPSTRHSLIKASEIATATDKDIIVIGTEQMQGLFTAWAAHMPLSIESGVRTIKEPLTSWRPSFRWEQLDIDPMAKSPSQISLSSSSGLVTMMGFESPLKAKRSVVFLYADKASDFQRLDDLMGDPARTSSIVGDFVVVDEKSVQATKASSTYFLGQIDFVTKVRWFLADNPIVVVVITLLVALLAAAALYRPLALLTRRARKNEL